MNSNKVIPAVNYFNEKETQRMLCKRIAVTTEEAALALSALRDEWSESHETPLHQTSSFLKRLIRILNGNVQHFEMVMNELNIEVVEEMNASGIRFKPRNKRMVHIKI